MIFLEDLGRVISDLPNPETLPEKRRFSVPIDCYEGEDVIKRDAIFEVSNRDGRRAWTIK